MKYFSFAFVLLVVCSVFFQSAYGDCWWTGCQKNDWKVKGCGQYARIQKGIRNCANGKEYNCCSFLG
ncbi:hypothetical protein M8J76_013158 [Diaphorina citri]|nr:hypothetical protein M8J75_003276 [Diaphorina citri]KAI5722761.1 hypothetical protein M8J76_013158 [Diaphorina citri]KAI5725875.1 hypothetical protein M8J77_021163 [Diaphorina citri]